MRTLRKCSLGTHFGNETSGWSGFKMEVTFITRSERWKAFLEIEGTLNLLGISWTTVKLYFPGTILAMTARMPRGLPMEEAAEQWPCPAGRKRRTIDWKVSSMTTERIGQWFRNWWRVEPMCNVSIGGIKSSIRIWLKDPGRERYILLFQLFNHLKVGIIKSLWS